MGLYNSEKKRLIIKYIYNGDNSDGINMLADQYLEFFQSYRQKWSRALKTEPYNNSRYESDIKPDSKQIIREQVDIRINIFIEKLNIDNRIW